MPPRLSDGWPHSAASQVSLKSSQRTIAPMAKAPCTGSSSSEVPGTRAPPGITAPGTTGAIRRAQAGTFSAIRPHASVSIRQSRAVSNASAETGGGALTKPAIWVSTASGCGALRALRIEC